MSVTLLLNMGSREATPEIYVIAISEQQASISTTRCGGRQGASSVAGLCCGMTDLPHGGLFEGSLPIDAGGIVCIIILLVFTIILPCVTWISLLLPFWRAGGLVGWMAQGGAARGAEAREIQIERERLRAATRKAGGSLHLPHMPSMHMHMPSPRLPRSKRGDREGSEASATPEASETAEDTATRKASYKPPEVPEEKCLLSFKNVRYSIKLPGSAGELSVLKGVSGVLHPGMRRTRAQALATLRTGALHVPYHRIYPNGRRCIVPSLCAFPPPPPPPRPRPISVPQLTSHTCYTGEMTAIMGPSGCGKSTLLDVLADTKTVGKINADVPPPHRPTPTLDSTTKFLPNPPDPPPLYHLPASCPCPSPYPTSRNTADTSQRSTSRRELPVHRRLRDAGV